MPPRKERIELICQECGKKFYRLECEIKRGRGKYCSRECANKAHSKRMSGGNNPLWKPKVKKICEWCGKEYYVKPSRASKSKYCSMECQRKAFGYNHRGENNPAYSQVKCVCEWCGKEFYVHAYRAETARFCSRECNAEYNKTRTGDKNPAWNGGYKGYYGENWHEQRRKALERDEHTCQICGAKENGRQHDVHHIIPFREFGRERYKEANDLSNLITLCKPCHIQAEHNGLITVVDKV